MRTITLRIGAAALAGVAALGLAAAEAQAQFIRPSMPGYAPGVGPFYNPGLRMGAAPGLYGVGALPPVMAGNPYGMGGPVVTTSFPPINPYGGGQGSNVYGQGGSGTNPYGSGGASGGDLSNPYSAALQGSGSTTSNPYISYTPDPYTGLLYGSADMLRASASMNMGFERARILRELAIRASLENRKQRFDLERYIKEHTPTLTQDQEKVAAETLRRVQKLASPGEIAYGRSVNILVKDLAKYRDKKATFDGEPIDEDILKHVNVTNGEYGPNLGFLRSGQFNWPAALQDLVPERERSEIEDLARSLYDLAIEGKSIDQLRNLELRVARLQTMLQDRRNELGSGEYLAARRFLNDFQSAARALRQGIAPRYAAFLRFIRGGKTAQEVAKYMIDHGLFFAPANAGEEWAYQALHYALASYDVAVNAQLGSANNPSAP